MTRTVLQSTNAASLTVEPSASLPHSVCCHIFGQIITETDRKLKIVFSCRFNLSLLPVMNPLFLQESQGCVHADSQALGCALSCALTTTTVPTRRSAATTDVDTSALRRTQVLFNSHTSVSDRAKTHDHSGLNGLSFFCSPCGVSVKRGRCGAPKGTPMCAEYCYHDGECPGEQKCCRTTCGHNCSEPC